MKLQKDIAAISKKRYLSYLKLFPQLQDKGKEYTTLLLTLGALSLFGIFAIKPTITTIVELKKQLADSTFAEGKLQQKILALGQLQAQYSELSSDLPAIFTAVPKNPEVPLLIGKIQSLTQKNNLSLSQLQVDDVEVTKLTPATQTASYALSLSVAGSISDLQAFLTDITRMDRIVTLDTLSYTTDAKEGASMTIKLKAFYKS